MEKYKINNTEIYQPDEDLGWDFEVTYTPDSARSQDGTGHFTEMFAVESFQYQASHVPVAEWTKMSKMIVGKKFDLYAWNPHFGKWRTHRCYVGKGTLNIGSLEDGNQKYSSISFTMIDIKPLEAQE